MVLVPVMTNVATERQVTRTVSANISIVSDYSHRCRRFRLRLPRHRQHCRLVKILHPSPGIYGLNDNLCAPLVESIQNIFLAIYLKFLRNDNKITTFFIPLRYPMI